MSIEGGRFDFDDGGSYVGEWNEGKAHGLGIATGPDNQGEYSGEWSHGFEQRGVYIWPSGNIYAGTWLKGKRHGDGVQVKGRWLYRGNFTTGFCGRYGVKESLTSCAKYEGSWHLNQFDGFGVETNSDGSIYSGAWSKGLRQGLGVRKSAPYGMASEQYKTVRAAQSQNSLPSAAGSDALHWRGHGSNGSAGGSATGLIDTERGRPEEIRSGFVLRANSCPGNQNQSREDKSFFDKKTVFSKLGIFKNLRKQKSTGDISNIGKGNKEGASSRAGSTAANLHLKSSSGNFSNIFRSGGSLRSNLSNISHGTGQSYTAGRHASAGIPASNAIAAVMGRSHPDLSSTEPFVDILGPNITEEYSGQWNEDKRSGYGTAERSDGLRYEGEWFNNKKDGYGCTYFPDGRKEEGRYRENILVQYLNRKSRLFLIRHSRLRDAVDEAVKKAQEASREARDKAAQTANQRADNARQVAIKADAKAKEARILSEHSRSISHEFDPDFVQLGLMWEKQNALVRPDLFGGSVSDDQIDDPYIHSDQPVNNNQPFNRSQSPSQDNKMLLTKHTNNTNTNSLQVSGGSRRGSFRSSFHRKDRPNDQRLSSNQSDQISPTSDNGAVTLGIGNQQQQQSQSFLDVNGVEDKISVISHHSKPLEPLSIETNLNNLMSTDVKIKPTNAQNGSLNQFMMDKRNQPTINFEPFPDDSQSIHSLNTNNKTMNRMGPSSRGNLSQQAFGEINQAKLHSDNQFDLESIKSLPMQQQARNYDGSLQNINNIRNIGTLPSNMTQNRFEQLKNLNNIIGNRVQSGRPMARAMTSGFTGISNNLTFQHPHSQYIDMPESETIYNPRTESNLGELSDERRKTLPSIMTQLPIKPASPSVINACKSSGLPITVEETLSDEHITYVIDDGVRKRFLTEYTTDNDKRTEEFVKKNLPPPPSYAMHTKKQEILKKEELKHRKPFEYDDESALPNVLKKFRVETDIGLGRIKESSMPDLLAIGEDGLVNTVTNRMIGNRLTGMTKREVIKLSQERKQELLKQSERRLRGEIIIRLADVKDWLRRNFSFVLFLILNASLALLFLHLLWGSMPSFNDRINDIMNDPPDNSRTVNDQQRPKEQTTVEKISQLGQKLIKKVSKKLKSKK